MARFIVRKQSSRRVGLRIASKPELANVRCVSPFFPAMTITSFPAIA